MTIEILDEIKKQRIKTYHVLTFPLDNARTDFELYITGGYLYVLVLTGLVSIRLNEISSDSIDLFKNREIYSPFYRIYITNAAQAGLILVLAIGVQSDYFQVRDYTAPDLSLMAGYTQQLRDSFAYAYGTQVAKSNTATATTTLIHTVSTGKTFLLEQWNLNIAIGASAGSGALIVTDGADATQYTICTLGGLANLLETQGGQGVISIPQNYKIKVYSGASGLNSTAFIKGREI